MRMNTRRLRPSAYFIAAALLLSFGCGEETDAFDYQTHVVKRGDVRIFVRQKGTIEARDPLNITCPIEGSTTILDIVPEGTFVKKGDKVCELDVSDKRDKLLQQRIDEQSAAEKHLVAEKKRDIQLQTNESEIKQAELQQLFAELDLRQYLEGELPTSMRTSEAEIALNQSEVKQLQDKLVWSGKLFEKGYISSDKLDSDRLMFERAQLDVTVSQDKLKLLNDYTKVKRKKELEAKLEEAGREVIRTKTKCEAAIAQAEGEVKSALAKLDLERAKMERLESQVKNDVLYATRDGIAVYARQGGGGRDARPMEVGAKVNEGQTIIQIPDLDRVLVDIDIHESMVHQVRNGLPVLVTTDTGEFLQGTIESIASIPDSQSWYRNPDLKVYSSKVTVENKGGKLKPGMNCHAEVIIDDLKGVLSLPVQCVYDSGDRSFVYVRKDGGAKLTEIKVGKQNGEEVAVLEGINEGDEIYLAPPPDAEKLPERRAKTENVEVKIPAAIPAAVGGAPTEEGAGRREGGRRREGAQNPGQGGNGAEGRRGGMSPEAMEKFKNMTPEEREAARKKMQEGRGRRDGQGAGTEGAPGSGGRPGGTQSNNNDNR